MNKTTHDSETPAHGQQVISACAFIHHTFDGVQKVFLPKRADSKKFLPGYFELPGGHIDFGEDIVAGLQREIQEEFGMTISVGDAFATFTYTNHIKGSHTIEVVYFAQFVEPIERIALNPEDHSTYEWFTAANTTSRRAELSPEELLQDGEDPEYTCIQKGFALLNGDSVRVS